MAQALITAVSVTPGACVTQIPLFTAIDIYSHSAASAAPAHAAMLCS